jgi:hypothetical protein
MEQHPGLISAEEVSGTWTAHLYEFSVATVLLVLLAVLLTIAVLGFGRVPASPSVSLRRAAGGGARRLAG